MFLIAEVDSPISRDESKPRDPFRAPNYRGPEPGASAEVDRILEAFEPGVDPRGKYHMDFSRFSGRKHSEMLRAIGAATYKNRKSTAIESGSGDHYPLLDSLAINLMRQQFGQHHPSGIRIYVRNSHSLFFESFASKHEEISEESFLMRLNDPFYWSLTKRSGGSTKSLDFLFYFEGSRETVKLSFLARIISNDSEEWERLLINEAIVEAKASSKGTSILLKSDFNGIVQDQQRRNELADRFAAAPRVQGLPGSMREEIEARLELAGAPRGSYSRLGFSSGRFPYSQTRVLIADLSAALNFERCAHCSCVEGLSLENLHGKVGRTAVRQDLTELITACNELDAQHIGPWHHSICTDPMKLKKMDLWDEAGS